MHNAKPVSSLMVSMFALSQHHEDPFSNPTIYSNMVGSLQYLGFTQQDIAFAISKICQFMHRLMTDHWCVIKRIIRYLRLTTRLFLSNVLPLTTSKHSRISTGLDALIITTP